MLPRVVFHHVHKCAGTTLLKFLEGTTAPERTAAIERLVGTPDPDGVERIAALLRAEFIHDPFGVHDWKTLLGNAVDVIFLRDPVERLWSEWRMITRWDDDLVAARGDRYRRLRDAARSGFATFLSLPGAAAFGNAVACHLAFGQPLLDEVRAACARAAPVPEPLVALLDQRLAAIDVVGFVEAFDASLHDLVAALGWPPPTALQAHNVHAATEPLTADARVLAERCTAIDRRLVAAARARAAARGSDADRLAVAAARGLARVVDPPAAVLVDMGDGLVGTGWHPAEVNGRRRTRWIGPGAQATLDLRIARHRPLGLRLRVGSHLRPSQVDGLRILADGVACDVDHWVLPPYDHFFETTIPVAAGALLRLAIDCREAVASPDRIDTRSLGVEIAEIELAPVARMPPRSLTALAHVRDQWALLAGTPDGDRRMQHFLDTLPGGTLARDVSCPPYAESRRG